jgi:hypothetical protein
VVGGPDRRHPQQPTAGTAHAGVITTVTFLGVEVGNGVAANGTAKGDHVDVTGELFGRSTTSPACRPWPGQRRPSCFPEGAGGRRER